MNENIDRSWEKRPFNKNDQEKIAELYKNVHSRPFELHEWKWQFQGAFAEEGYIWVADHQGTLAGQYATVPIRMQIANQNIKGALSLDTMTHSDFRKQGIFVTLAKEVYNQLGSKDVKLVYGFPNENSFRGFIKHLDFVVLENLPALTRPLNISEILRSKIRNGVVARLVGTPVQTVFDVLFKRKIGSRDIKIEQKPEFPKEVDQLFRELSPEFPNLVIRDYSYLKWRYDQNPQHNYDNFFGYRSGKLAGFCVCSRTERKGITIGLIVDLFASPSDEELIASLVKTAIQRFSKQKMMLVSCMLTKESPFKKILNKLGFIFPIKRFPFIIRRNTDDLDINNLITPRNWHITYGDGDFV